MHLRLKEQARLKTPARERGPLGPVLTGRIEVVPSLRAARVAALLPGTPGRLHGEVGQARRRLSEGRDRPAAEADHKVALVVLAGVDDRLGDDPRIIGWRRVLG